MVWVLMVRQTVMVSSTFYLDTGQTRPKLKTMMIISSEAFLGWIFYRFSYKSRTSTQRVFRVLEKAWYAHLYSLLFSCSVVSSSLRPHGLQHARPPCPSTSLGVCSNSCPLSWWCHPIILSSVVPITSHLQSFPASLSFSLSWLLQ